MRTSAVKASAGCTTRKTFAESSREARKATAGKIAVTTTASMPIPSNAEPRTAPARSRTATPVPYTTTIGPVTHQTARTDSMLSRTMAVPIAAVIHMPRATTRAHSSCTTLNPIRPSARTVASPGLTVDDAGMSLSPSGEVLPPGFSFSAAMIVLDSARSRNCIRPSCGA